MICLSRIDDRLIHGQVVTTWVNLYNIEQILVLNDAVAHDTLQKNILTMAAPQNVTVKVFEIEKLASILKKTTIQKRTLLLFTTSVDVLRAVEAGIPVTVLNIGGMRYQEGRAKITKSLAVTVQERAAFQQLLTQGVDISIQMVPNDEKVNLREVL